MLGCDYHGGSTAQDQWRDVVVVDPVGHDRLGDGTDIGLASRDLRSNLSVEIIGQDDHRQDTDDRHDDQ